MKLTSLALVLGLFLSSMAFAADTETPPPAAPAAPSRSLTLVVVLHDKRTFQDGPVVRVKEAGSGKVAQITLRKAAKIPNAWANFFLITFSAGDSSSRTLEFFTLKDSKYLTYFRSDKKVQRVDLFRDEASLTAFIAAEQMKVSSKLAAKTQGSSSVTISAPTKLEKSSDQNSKVISQEALIEKAKQESLVQQQAKVVLEEQQSKARLAQLEQQKLLSEAQKKQNQKKAQDLEEQGNTAYAKEDYNQSEKFYSESLQLDPSNDSVYYKYGVSLYKTENYIQSLANLSLADVSDSAALQKDYYVALNYMKLKDYDKALEQFKDVKDENDPTLSPVASFFAGNIEYQQQKFPDARKSMEYAIDNSNEPSLAKTAEDFLEQIDRTESFYNRKKEKYRTTFFGGLTYDTNVLNIAENNIATDAKAIRLNAGASLLGIWYRDLKSDFGTEVMVSDYYSVNSSLQGDANIQATDPLDVSLMLPYHRQVEIGKRTADWEFVPTYRSIYMAPTGGSRSQVISSLGVNSTLALSLTQDWYLSNRLDFSMDNSYLSSAADDDQTSKKYGITIAPTKLLDLQGQKTLTADISYLMNDSLGKNNKYKKTGLGLTYGFPSLWASQGSLRVAYDMQNYGEASVTRTDKVSSLLLASAKDLNASWNFLASLLYSNSSSEVSTYNYSKFVVTGLFTYRMSYLEK